MLVHAERGVEIEEVIRAYELQSLVQGNGTSDVGTTAGGTSVLTFYILPMYVEVFRFVVEAHRPAVTLIVVAFMNVRIVERVGDGMPTSDLSCSNEVESFHRAVFQSSYEVLLLVTVFLVDTLSVHYLYLIAQFAVVGLTKNGESQVTTILHAHQRVAATACQIGHTF